MTSTDALKPNQIARIQALDTLEKSMRQKIEEAVQDFAKEMNTEIKIRSIHNSPRRFFAMKKKGITFTREVNFFDMDVADAINVLRKMFLMLEKEIEEKRI